MPANAWHTSGNGKRMIPDLADAQFHQTFTLPSGDVIGFADFGPRDGRPVLFMHGWPGCRLQSIHAYGMVHELGIRMITPDRPGLGLSSAQPERKITDWPAQMAALMDHLGIGPFDVLGESGGCPYSLALAHALPERVRKVGILCGAPPLSEFTDLSDLFPVFRLLLAIHRHLPALQDPALGLATWYTRHVPDRWLLAPMLAFVPPRDRQAMREPQALPAYLAMAHGTYDGGPQPVRQDGELFLANWGFDWRQIQQEVHFWHGSDDQTLPVAKTRWLAEQLPNGYFTLVNGEGHYSLPIYYQHEALKWLQADS